LVNNKNRAKTIRFLNSLFHKVSSNILGMGGLFLNLVYLSNLVTSGRKAYLLIKRGVFYVNDKQIFNPYINVKVGARFGVNQSWIVLYFRYLKFRYKKRRVLFKVPSFIDVDYRQLRFKIYRMPLKYETDLFPFGERFN
jgi:ribosomal protein S4